MSKVIIHVKTSRFRASEQVIGFRLEAAIPNMEGRVMKCRHSSDGKTDGFYATDDAAPSFRKPWFVREFSDHSSITKKIIQRFVEDLKWTGYSEFEFVGKYDGDPLSDMMR